jgi:hypothetical protein
MRKKEVYKTLIKSDIEQVQCELCDKLIDEDDLIEISSNKDSTILCNSCASKLNNVSSFYDE